MTIMPTKRPNMNSRFTFSANSRNVHDMNASQRTDITSRIMRALYTAGARLSNWKSLLAFLFLMLPTLASAATLLPPGKNCFYDANANPLAGGTVQFYIPSTTTPKDTWQNSGQTILNTNPVVLDSAGCSIIYGSGVYRQVLKDQLGNLIWDQLTSDTSGLQISWGGVSTGTANAQVLPSSGNFSQQSGQVVGFTAGVTNTGATTVSVGGSPIPVVTDTLSGPNSLTAGQITANNLVAMMYDQVGGKFHILNTPFPTITFPTLTLSVQTFTIAGTYTPPANLSYAKVTCTGGGGGGGGIAASGVGGRGGAGGGGSTSFKILTGAQIGASQAITIGAGGTGATAGNNNGNAGGDTSFGAFCIGKGASGGGGGAANASGAAGAGGVAGTGDWSVAGQSGTPGMWNNTTGGGYSGYSSIGGGTFWGGGQVGLIDGGAGTGNAGVAATLCGTGGTGGSSTNSTSRAGGNGANGCVVVEEFVYH